MNIRKIIKPTDDKLREQIVGKEIWGWVFYLVIGVISLYVFFSTDNWIVASLLIILGLGVLVQWSMAAVLDKIRLEIRELKK